jgi:molybdopterin biosynthesis enzyme
LYATRGKKHIFGLPGNPLAVLAGFHLFVLPALRRLAGIDPSNCRGTMRLPLMRQINCKENRTELCLGQLINRPNGSTVCAIPSRGSADLVSAVQADGFIIVEPQRKTIRSNEIVEFIPWLTRQ